MAELNSIQKFYKNKTIFITGGKNDKLTNEMCGRGKSFNCNIFWSHRKASGFMGKVLLEKLLYSCSDLKEIVILMRPKRGKSEAERVADFVNIPVIIKQ